MSIARVIALTLVLGLAAALAAQDFDALDYYGDSFQPDPNEPASGILKDSLKGAQPNWIEFSGSGEDLAADRFKISDAGLSVRPNGDHGTCEAVIDAGVAGGALQVEVHEIAQGSALAWHLRDLVSEQAWLIELKHKHKGGYQLRVRVKNQQGRYTVAPGSLHEIEALALPANFIAHVSSENLVGEVGGMKTEHANSYGNGVSVGLAVTDETARLSDLSLDVKLHENWIVEAHERLLARNALGRLREFATIGLLSGISEYRHPGIEGALEVYSDEEAATRRRAQGADLYERASLLKKIADAHPKLPAAQHEAGVAALISGNIAAARVMLANADKLQRTNITSLALAEANRRANDINAAENSLREANAELPEGLRADYALIEGRLCADRGDIEGAEKILRRAGRAFPEHNQLQAFADSASVLYDPSMLQQSSVEGPMGLTLVTDLSPAQFVPVLEKLAPYVEKFRLWLPRLEDKLEGRIAIFSGPVAYLRAALLVAGDNIDNVAGMYLSHGIRGGATVMACRAFGEDELLRTLVHELWHLALASTGAERSVPRWLNEGMAVFLSAGHVENGVMRYNTLPSEFDGYLKTAPTADQLEGALTATPADFYMPGLLRENYASAWSVALLYATENRSMEQLRDMLRGNAGALAGVNAARIHKAVSKAVEDVLNN